MRDKKVQKNMGYAADDEGSSIGVEIFQEGWLISQITSYFKGIGLVGKVIE